MKEVERLCQEIVYTCFFFLQMCLILQTKINIFIILVTKQLFRGMVRVKGFDDF